MPRRAVAAVALGLLVVLVWHSAQQPSRRVEPALAQELRGLPEVADVATAGPHDAKLVVIQLCDWFDPNDPELSERVQHELMTVIRHLRTKHRITAAYAEGLSKESLPDFELRIKFIKDTPAHPLAKQFTLEIGAPGRLLMSGVLKEVLPLDDQAALAAAKPDATGKLGPCEG